MLYFEKMAKVEDVIHLKQEEMPDRVALLKVPETASLMQLIGYMADHDVGIAFVYDRYKKILGLISERDIMRHIALNDLQAFQMPIKALINQGVISCRLGDKLKSVAAEMADNHIRHVAVTDENGVYVGVVSASDIERFAGQG